MSSGYKKKYLEKVQKDKKLLQEQLKKNRSYSNKYRQRQLSNSHSAIEFKARRAEQTRAYRQRLKENLSESSSEAQTSRSTVILLHFHVFFFFILYL
jgi:hypothetical protein